MFIFALNGTQLFTITDAILNSGNQMQDSVALCGVFLEIAMEYALKNSNQAAVLPWNNLSYVSNFYQGHAAVLPTYLIANGVVTAPGAIPLAGKSYQQLLAIFPP